MMKSTQDAFPERREMLMQLLCINPEWRMHQLSDGQRRRVQIFLQLLRPSEILLLDEITTDLDVITRQDFLQFLKVRHAAITPSAENKRHVPHPTRHLCQNLEHTLMNKHDNVSSLCPILVFLSRFQWLSATRSVTEFRV